MKIKKPCKNCGADNAVNVALANYPKIVKSASNKAIIVINGLSPSTYRFYKIYCSRDYSSYQGEYLITTQYKSGGNTFYIESILPASIVNISVNDNNQIVIQSSNGKGLQVFVETFFNDNISFEYSIAQSDPTSNENELS